jgi:replicative superfamily II helicase
LLVKNANLSAPLLNGWTLFPHQKKAILRSLLMRRFILALDMGLGKTLIGCVWAKAFQQTFEDLKIIVVCPVSLKKEWKRTAEEATGLQVSDDGDESADMQINGWSKTPSQVSNAVTKYVVVFDEAHSMQVRPDNRGASLCNAVYEYLHLRFLHIAVHDDGSYQGSAQVGSIYEMCRRLDVNGDSHEERKAFKSISSLASC